MPGLTALASCVIAIVVTPALAHGAAIVTDADPNSMTLGDGNTLVDRGRVEGRADGDAGQIRFRLFAPSNPGCSTIGINTWVFQTFRAYPAGMTTFVSTGSGPAQPQTPTQAGTYRWVADYFDEDLDPATDPPTAAGSCTDPTEDTDVSRASPTLGITPSTGAKLLSPTPTITALAKLSGSESRLAPSNTPGGSGWITFDIYGPSHNGENVNNCNGTPLTSIQMPFPTNDDELRSNAYTPIRAGTYRWRATYHGDANNDDDASACEATTVAKATPTVTPVPSADSIRLGEANLTDAVTVTDTAIPADPGPYTADIQFFIYGPEDTACAKPPRDTFVKNAAEVGAVTSPAYEPTGRGLYQWKVLYTGDANNEIGRAHV